MPDLNISCVDCGEEFVHSEGEQALFAERHYEHLPKRCKECRRIKHASFGDNPHLSYESACTACGGIATVPFEPIGGRPVFCERCWAEKHKH